MNGTPLHRRLVEYGIWVRQGFDAARFRIENATYAKDGRKRKSIIKGLVSSGYMADTGKAIVPTEKAYQEVTAQPPDLPAIWAEQNRCRRKPLDLICFNTLPLAGQKWLVERDEVAWYWLSENLTRYYVQGDPTDTCGPFAIGEAAAKHKEANAAKDAKRPGGINGFELYLTTPLLTQHIREARAAEQLAGAMTNNLGWGAAKLGLLSEEEAKHVSAAKQQASLYTEWGNIGDDPTKWGETLDDNIVGLGEKIEKLQEKLVVLVEFRHKVSESGGWLAFRQKYEKLIREALTKQGS